MPTGLQKLALEVPFKGGLTEKIHEDMAEPQGMYLIENAELTKVGGFQRRSGFEIMTRAIVGSASTIGDPRKIAGRMEELFIVTEDHGALGSGGGAGATGAQLYGYSPEANAWASNGLVSGVTLERFAGLANGQANLKSIDTGYISSSGKEYVVVAYVQGEWLSSNAGVYFAVYDASSRTMIREPQVLDTYGSFGGRVQIVSIGRYAVILFRDAGSVAFKAVIYDAFDNTVSSPITIFSAGAKGATGWWGTTDGTSLFLAYDNSNITVEKFAVTATTLVSGGTATAAATVTYRIHAAYTGNVVHVTWMQNTVGIKYWSTTTAPASIATPITLSANHDSTSRTYAAALSGDDVAVFWDRVGTTTTDYSVSWKWVKLASTAPAARTNEHRIPGVQVGGNPFVFGGRVFVAFCGVSYGQPVWEGDTAPAELAVALSNFGHVLCEIGSNPAAEDVVGGNQYLTALPVGVWSRDTSRFTIPGNGAFGGSSDRYIASIRQVRTSDSFLIEKRGQLIPTAHSVAVWSVDIMRFQFADAKRWQHAEGQFSTTLASGLPYTYDGMNTHECGYIFRPAIMSITEIASGSYTTGDDVFFKLVYEWEDAAAGRWFSDTSFTAEHVVVGTSKALEIRVRVPSISAKPLGAWSFTGRVKVNLYRTTFEEPDEFKFFGSQTFMIFDSSGNPEVNFYLFVDDASTNLDSNERIYTFGGELDNACAPPCRSLVSHRDRLFAIDTEDNYLWYTKPFTRGRGIEWSRYQKIPLPNRGMALASVEGQLLVFCENKTLVLEGQGPGVTGQPPDAYSRLAVLSQDQGCSEINATWRTPVGTLFRSYHGLWSVGGQLGMSYLGAHVQDSIGTVIRFVDGNVDESRGCLRLLATNGGAYFMVNFWYDTNRWSIDRYDLDSAGTHYSSFFHRGDFYKATTKGVLKLNRLRWLDGDEDPENTYLMKVRSGRYRMDSMSGFKRLWRMLCNVVFPNQDSIGPLVGPALDLQLTVETQGSADSEEQTSTQIFKGKELEGTTPKAVRLHVKHQKGQSFRLTAEETPNVDTTNSASGPPGYTFLGFGMELGTKRGAAKLPEGRSR